MIVLKIHDGDRYDAENGQFVLLCNSNLRQIATFCIVEHNGMQLECYLNKVTFIKAEQRGKRSTYEICYKIYEDNLN